MPLARCRFRSFTGQVRATIVEVTDPALDSDHLVDLGWWVAAAFIAWLGCLALLPAVVLGTHKVLSLAGLGLLAGGTIVSLVPTAVRQGRGKQLLAPAAARAGVTATVVLFVVWQARWIV